MIYLLASRGDFLATSLFLLVQSAPHQNSHLLLYIYLFQALFLYLSLSLSSAEKLCSCKRVRERGLERFFSRDTMSATKDQDPRIHGISSSIRVVPNFPKPGLLPISISLFFQLFIFSVTIHSLLSLLLFCSVRICIFLGFSSVFSFGRKREKKKDRIFSLLYSLCSPFFFNYISAMQDAISCLYWLIWPSHLKFLSRFRIHRT